MPKRNNNPPEILVVAGQRYKLTVFRIQSKYEDDTPEDCTLIKDDTVCELSEDKEKNLFMTAYVPMSMLKGPK